MSRNPYAPPESTVEQRPVVTQPASDPPRGFLLTALLVVLFLGNVFQTFFYFLVVIGTITLPRNGAWAPALLVLAAANVVFLVALWNWRRWGLFGLIGTAILLFTTRIAQGQMPRDAAVGILGLAVLIAVASLKAKHCK